MARKTSIDQLNDFFRNRVGFKSTGLGQYSWPLFTKTLAIFSVKIPSASNWFFAIHQDAIFQPHFAVKKL